MGSDCGETYVCHPSTEPDVEQSEREVREPAERKTAAGGCRQEAREFAVVYKLSIPNRCL